MVRGGVSVLGKFHVIWGKDAPLQGAVVQPTCDRGVCREKDGVCRTCGRPTAVPVVTPAAPSLHCLPGGPDTAGARGASVPDPVSLEQSPAHRVSTARCWGPRRLSPLSFRALSACPLVPSALAMPAPVEAPSPPHPVLPSLVHLASLQADEPDRHARMHLILVERCEWELNRAVQLTTRQGGACSALEKRGN